MRWNSREHRLLAWMLPLLAMLCIGWADSWEGLKSTAETITSVKATFIQEKHLPILSKPLISEGIFYYQSPGSFRWEYRRPVQSILLMHDGRIERYVKGDAGFEPERSAGLEAMQVVMDQITEWLRGRFDQSTMFEARLAPDGKIIMVPREAAFKEIILRIEISLAELPGVIKEVLIYESEDAFTRMRFADTTLNEKIEESVFRKVP